MILPIFLSLAFVMPNLEFNPPVVITPADAVPPERVPGVQYIRHEAKVGQQVILRMGDPGPKSRWSWQVEQGADGDWVTFVAFRGGFSADGETITLQPLKPGRFVLLISHLTLLEARDGVKDYTLRFNVDVIK